MSTPLLRLNDNHRNTLLSAFMYMDQLLSEGVAGLTPAEEGAIFSLLKPDATATQRKIISDQVARLRRSMRDALNACSIPVRPPTIGALWSLRNSLTFIDIALEDLSKSHLSGYGAVDENSAEGIMALQAQIRAVLADLQSYVASGTGGDLAARFSRLDKTKEEVLLLSEIERIITAHGLVELRQALSLLLERLEKNWWTVAFVGRVNSGKSSLLNYLLATDILPSGVTPVTAVPVRITSGPEIVATVSFASGRPARVPGLQLRDFASEEHNPGNEQHVTDILLELPAARLTTDVCFVDTPGLGSLATAGAAQTLGFLPRCDLGVFLVDCCSTLAEEDLSVIRTLFDGGADVLVVLSKADLLTLADRERVLAYVRRQLAANLSREVPVSLVSVASGFTMLADSWFDTALAPQQAVHLQLAAQALRRKAGGLKEVVEAVLTQRSGHLNDAFTSQGTAIDVAAARAVLQSNRRRLYDSVLCATPRADEAIDHAVVILVQEPSGSSPEDLSRTFAEVLVYVAARMGDACDRLLQETRRAVVEVFASANGTAIVPDFPVPTSRPLYDPAATVAAVGIDSRWRRWPTSMIRRAVLRRCLLTKGKASLDETLQAYRATLLAWGQRYIDDLNLHFNAEVGIAEAGAGQAASTARPREILRDLDLLRNWNGQVRVTS